MLFNMPGALTRSLYASGATDTLVTGANVRSTMLPADARTGIASFEVAAGAMPVGSQLQMFGAGTIGARITAPPGFNFIPWVSVDGGVTKTDMTGFSHAPLLGTDGICELWMVIVQLATGVRPHGFVKYGASSGMPYNIPINPGGTGAAGSAPVVTSSNPNVKRTFGVDGYWGAGADAREYVKCRGVTTILIPAM